MGHLSLRVRIKQVTVASKTAMKINPLKILFAEGVIFPKPYNYLYIV